MRIIISLCLLLAASLAPAQSPSKLWQLDLIAFDRNSDAYGSFDDTWRFRRIEWPEMLPLTDSTIVPNDAPGGSAINTASIYVTQTAAEQGISILPAESSMLRDANNRLARSARYRVLGSYSVRFAQNVTTPRLQLSGGDALRLIARDTREDSGSGMDYWLSAPDLEPPVDTQAFLGWARLDHQIHPILQIDLRLLDLLSGVYPLQVDPDGRQEYFRDQIQQYRLKQERRLRPGMTAYFDHPRIGLLARLSEITPAADDPS